jgi:hypothetical protein
MLGREEGRREPQALEERTITETISPLRFQEHHVTIVIEAILGAVDNSSSWFSWSRNDCLDAVGGGTRRNGDLVNAPALRS